MGLNLYKNPFRKSAIGLSVLVFQIGQIGLPDGMPSQSGQGRAGAVNDGAAAIKAAEGTDKMPAEYMKWLFDTLLPIDQAVFYFLASGWLTAIDMRFYTKWEPDSLTLRRRLWFIARNSAWFLWVPLLTAIIARLIPLQWYGYAGQVAYATLEITWGNILCVVVAIISSIAMALWSGKGAIYLAQTIFGWPQKVSIVTRRRSY